EAVQVGRADKSPQSPHPSRPGVYIRRVRGEGGRTYLGRSVPCPEPAHAGEGLREPRGDPIAAQKSAEGIVGRSRRSARAGHSPERGEIARARTTGNEWPKARTTGGASRPRDSWVTRGRKSSTCSFHWPS